LTQRNTERKIGFVGPLVAADSESNLHQFSFVVAPCDAVAEPARSGLAAVGGTVVAAKTKSAVRPCAVGDLHAPPGWRHRRSA
jgi:hypothetical protein